MKKAKEKPAMMARALAKAKHEDAMLTGTDPLVVEVVNPFQVPEFMLPDPIEIHMSLSNEIDGILGVKVS